VSLEGRREENETNTLTTNAHAPDSHSHSTTHSHAKSCPQCGSNRLYRDGLRYLADGSSVQRWLCRNCGSRFSESEIKVNITGQVLKGSDSGKNHTNRRIASLNFSSKEVLDSSSFNGSEDVGSHGVTTVEQGLNPLRICNREHRVCATLRSAKNLETETRQEQAQREGTTQTAEIKGKILAYLWHLKKLGRNPETAHNYGQKLFYLLREGVNLEDPETIKAYLVNKEGWSSNSRFFAATVYDGFAKFLGLKWEKPRYKLTRKLPFIPKEQEIDALVACSGKNVSALLQLLKETGMRVGEALRLQWTDIDSDRNVIILNDPEKGSNPRIFKVSNVLLEKLALLPKTCSRIFANGIEQSVSANFRTQRKRIAAKLGNPRLMRISFHTFRHWKATMEYHKTRDILHVMEMLGHKNIRNTLIYTQLIKLEEEDEFYSSTAKNTEEAKRLIEDGFDYVCTTPEDLMLFRKRK
jgi:integrase